MAAARRLGNGWSRRVAQSIEDDPRRDRQVMGNTHVNHLRKFSQALIASVYRHWLSLVLPFWIAASWLVTRSVTVIGSIVIALTAIVRAVLKWWIPVWTTRRVSAPDATEPTLASSGTESCTFVVLPAYARADEVASSLFTQQYFFPVVQGNEIVGVLSKARLLSALANGQCDRLVAELMSKGYDRVADAGRTDERSTVQSSCRYEGLFSGDYSRRFQR